MAKKRPAKRYEDESLDEKSPKQQESSFQEQPKSEIQENPEVNPTENQISPEQQPEIQPIEQEIVAEPEEFPDVDTEFIEKKLIEWVKPRHNDAQALTPTFRQQWIDFRHMLAGTGAYTDNDDPLLQLPNGQRVHIKLLGKALETWRANLMRDIFSTSTSTEQEWFTVTAAAPGLEYYTKRVVAKMRKVLKSMRPNSARSFRQLIDMSLADLFEVGNMFYTVTSEKSLSYDIDFDGVIESATINYLNPFNVYPWRNDIDKIEDTCVSILTPMTNYELFNIPSPNLKIMKETLSASGTKNVPDHDDDGAVSDTNGTEGQLAEDKPIDSIPIYDVARVYFWWPDLDLTELCDKDESKGDLITWVDALAAKFSFDPVTALSTRWWQMDFVDEIVVDIRPVEEMLPEGRGPVGHFQMIKHNGRLLGEGFFERSQWDERFFNKWYRAFFHRADLLSNPPWWYDKSMVDRKWLADNQGDLRITKCQGIPIDRDAGNNSEPIGAIRFNEQDFNDCLQSMSFFDGRWRENTGITSAWEGSDKSRTATQSENNLTQSAALHEYYLAHIGHILLDQLERIYCIFQDNISNNERPDYIEFASDNDPDTMEIMQLDIRPENLIRVDLVSFELVGNRSSSNRARRIEALQAILALFMPMGIFNPYKSAKMFAEISGLNGISSIMNKMDPFDVQEAMRNLLYSFGNKGASMMMSPEMSGQLGAPGVTGEQALPPQGEQQGNGKPTFNKQFDQRSGGAGGKGTPLP